MVEESAYYRQQSQSAVPVKWMVSWLYMYCLSIVPWSHTILIFVWCLRYQAPESIRDKLTSTKRCHDPHSFSFSCWPSRSNISRSFFILFFSSKWCVEFWGADVGDLLSWWGALQWPGHAWYRSGHFHTDAFSATTRVPWRSVCASLFLHSFSRFNRVFDQFATDRGIDST